jgi:hypothetical protein
MVRIGKLDREQEGLFVAVEYGRSEQGYKLKLTEETRVRIHNELNDSLENVDREDEYWNTIKPQIQNTIDILL